MLTVKIENDYLADILRLKGETAIGNIAYPQREGGSARIQYLPAYQYKELSDPNAYSKINIRVPSN